jgi:hypothetical protein
MGKRERTKEAAKKRRETARRKWLEVVTKGPELLKREEDAVFARLLECLVAEGYLEDTGERRPGRDGKLQIVYRRTDKQT